MKKVLALILIWSLLLCSCSSVVEENQGADNGIDISEDAPENTSNENDNNEGLLNDEVKVNETGTVDIDITGLGDEKLITYVENNVYSDLINQLDSEDYLIENVEAIYYPKEYIEALVSNSQPNIYFGFTSAELNEKFQGEKYVFTLGKDGQTVVVPMDTVTDDIYVEAMENVIIGAGVILVCVTVSIVAAPAAPAVAMIFSASASSGITFALESGAISFAAAAIVKGYETESFEQAMKAGVKAGSEGFKWGAIIGTIAGGAEKAIALKGATLNGLSMNDAARIQKESGYPLEVIKQFKSVEEYNVYKEAGLYTKMVNGKLALVRDIDLNYVSELPNGESVTNLMRMQKGYAPIDPATGKAYQLHHVHQDPNGTLAILTEAEHQGNSVILNIFGKESEIDRAAFDKIRSEFWKKFAAGLV